MACHLPNGAGITVSDSPCLSTVWTSAAVYLLQVLLMDDACISSTSWLASTALMLGICMHMAMQASSGAENADMMQRELALLQEGPSDSDDTMADDSDEPLGQDLGLQFGGCEMQPDHDPPTKRVSILRTTQVKHRKLSSFCTRAGIVLTG